MHGDSERGGFAVCAESGANESLVLRRCTTFWTRLQGLYGLKLQGSASMSPRLLGQQGLYLQPCCAVHTLGLRMPIDVIFMDAGLNEIKRVDRMRPNRVSVCWKATLAVELPSGYCQRYPNYLSRIKTALDK